VVQTKVLHKEFAGGIIMNKFTFSYPTKVYFGEGSAEQAFSTELDKAGETVMLAFGGGSVKKV
jgi:alcohol dehydrogenase YqhD (iron-dependent ADH family)